MVTPLRSATDILVFRQDWTSRKRERDRTVDERKVSFWILFQRGEREKGREEFLVFAQNRVK